MILQYFGWNYRLMHIHQTQNGQGYQNIAKSTYVIIAVEMLVTKKKQV